MEDSTTYQIRGLQDLDALDFLDPEIKRELRAEFVAKERANGARCSMCLAPGDTNHKNQGDCVAAFQRKLAALESDPGYIPAPAVPPLPFDQMKQRAYDNYRQNIEKFQKLGLLWHEPTAAEIYRVTGMRK